jgi:response regulator RpfG family c-di-GMP phosphodiesterase
VSEAGTDTTIPTVLVVDDEAHIVSALQRTMRREPWAVLTADSGFAALDLLARRRVHVILSDQKMPGMSGLDLLARARALQPDAVRILITGWTEEVPREQIDALGVRALLPKPWEDAILKQVVRDALAVATAPSRS